MSLEPKIFDFSYIKLWHMADLLPLKLQGYKESWLRNPDQETIEFWLIKNMAIILSFMISAQNTPI